MSEKIVQLNEEIIKGAAQRISSRKCRRNPERAAGEGGRVADAGGPL